MKKSFLFLRISLTILIFAFLIYKVGLNSILKAFSEVSLIFIVPILLLWMLLLFLSSINFQILLKAVKVKMGFNKLFRYYLLSWSSGLFLPSKIGELILLHFFKKEKVPTGQGLMIYILDKLITILLLLILTLIMVFAFSDAYNILFYITIISILISLFLFATFIPNIRIWVLKHIIRKYSKYFDGFSKTLYHFLKYKKKNLFENLLITSLKVLISTSAIFLLFLSFGHPVNFLNILLIDSAVNIISFIPITISGLGLKESSAVILYTTFLGLSPAIVTSTYLLGSILTYFLGFSILTLLKMEDYV